MSGRAKKRASGAVEKEGGAEPARATGTKKQYRGAEATKMLEAVRHCCVVVHEAAHE